MSASCLPVNRAAVPAAGGKVIADLNGFTGPIDFIGGYPPALRARMGLTLKPGPSAQVVRYTVDPGARTVSADVLRDGVGETPEINPSCAGRPYRYAWLTSPESDGSEPEPYATLWAHGIYKLDLDSRQIDLWNAGPGHFVSQPVFIPRAAAAAEDDAYILVFVLDGNRKETDAVLLDARAPSKGPIATMHLHKRVAVPGTHAAWFAEMRAAELA